VYSELVAPRRRQHQQQRVATHVHVRGVRGAHAEPQGVARELPRRQHQREALPQVRRRGRVGDEFGDVAAREQQPGLLVSRAHQVPGLAAHREEQRQPQRDHHRGARHESAQHVRPARPAALH
jgi:hypothetical protein